MNSTAKNINGAENFHDRYDGDVIIHADSVLNLYGTINGTISIKPGGLFNLHGMVNGRIIIEQEGQLFLHGMMKGNILNNGFCQIWGVVKGSIHTEDGETIVDEDASIGTN